MSDVALKFNDYTFSPVTRQNEIWIRSTELAKALGYKREDEVARLYRNNADEFTPNMTQVIEIAVNTDSVLPAKTRIFSLRGCHLLAMFARTPVAKEFRKWVLDVLDRLPELIAPRPTPKPDPTEALTGLTEPAPGTFLIYYNPDTPVRGVIHDDQFWFLLYDMQRGIGKHILRYERQAPDTIYKSPQRKLSFQHKANMKFLREDAVIPYFKLTEPGNEAFIAWFSQTLLPALHERYGVAMPLTHACNVPSHTEINPEMRPKLQAMLTELAEMQKRCQYLMDQIPSALGNTIMYYAGNEQKYRMFYTLQHLRSAAADSLFLTQNLLATAWNLGRGISFS